MTPWQFLEQWQPIIPVVVAGLAIACFMGIAILVTRYITNENWRRDLSRTMPAKVIEQLALRDRRIADQDEELQVLRRRVEAQDVALRAVQRITWEIAPVTPIEKVPHYPQMRSSRG